MIVLDEIRGEMVAAAWHLFEPLLQKGIDAVATSRTTEEIRSEVDAGRFRLWAIYEATQPMPLLAAAASYTRRTNRGQVAVIDTIGGRDMHVWLESALAEFAALAKTHGVTRIEIEGRVGWARALPGFRTTRVILEKALT